MGLSPIRPRPFSTTMNLLTQKEAAAALGVSTRQFVRYRFQHQWLQPKGYQQLAPMFSEEQIAKLKVEVLRRKLCVLAALSEAKKKPVAKVVSMDQLRKARGQ